MVLRGLGVESRKGGEGIVTGPSETTRLSATLTGGATFGPTGGKNRSFDRGGEEPRRAKGGICFAG